jgi:DNA-binding NarL/FixJ family response regulator
MSRTSSARLGNVGALAKVVRSLPNPPSDAVARKRKMVADFCHLLGEEYSRPVVRSIPGLSRRHEQTLEGLLAGDSEKQIAHKLGVSRNTVHVYVTALYRRFDVSSRGELLAKFLNRQKWRIAATVKA